MKIVVRSDVYVQLNPKKLSELRELVNSPSKYSYYRFNYSPGIHGEQLIYAVTMLQFTNLEIFKILEKAIKIVEDTEQYTKYLLDDTFGEKKYFASPPGTVRFYSQDLICFYNGKSWRKLDKPVVHI